MEIVYSYWDGSGHRRSTVLKKGNTIQQFLYRCLEQLRKENQFNELKARSFFNITFTIRKKKQYLNSYFKIRLHL